jgi:hypothetical protein
MLGLLQGGSILDTQQQAAQQHLRISWLHFNLQTNQEQ